MSEYQSPSTPEKSSPKLPRVPEGLQVAVLDDLLGYQSEIRAKYGQQPEDKDYGTFESEFIDSLLHENGIRLDEDDEKSIENYNFAKGIYSEVIKMDKNYQREWLGTPRDGEKTRRALVMDAVAGWYQKSEQGETAVGETAETDSSDPYESSVARETSHEAGREKAKAQDETVEHLHELREKYAELIAERSKRMFEGSTREQDITHTREELSDTILAIATEMMDDLERDGLSEEEITKQIEEFVAEQTEVLVSAMEAKRVEDYENSRPIMKKFYDKWAQWGTEGTGVFSKGKLKKAAVFAVPGAAFGVALAPVVGAVGFGVVTGAIAVTGARSIGRRLAGAHFDKKADAKRVAAEQSTDISTRIKQADEREITDADAHKDGEAGKNLSLVDIMAERSTEYRKQNRNRMVGGMAIALSVGLLTAKGADILADNVDNWSFGAAGEKIGATWDKYFPGEADVDKDVNTNTPDTSPGTDLGAEGSGRGNDGTELSTRDELFNGQFGGRELTPDGQKELENYFDGHRVKPGDTVWDLSEKFLQDQGIKNPTVYEIDATKDVLLSELRATNSVDSRGWLSVGDKIRIK